jgi:diguanylate cyclase (GGDEF)-like protein
LRVSDFEFFQKGVGVTMIGNPALARHILIVEDQQGRRTITLEDTRYTIGRNSNNSIVIYSKQASRRHATLIRKVNSQTNQCSFWILDGDLEGNKSHNGIFINGQKCLVHELKDGDLVNFGCNVNASYHILANFSETFADKQGRNFPTTYKPPESPSRQTPPLQKSLIISEGHVQSSINHDKTFQAQVYHDPLTSLPNRSLFNEYLSIALKNAKRHQSQLGIICLDIDQFQLINNRLGYLLGDRLLQSFAKRLQGCFRSVDIVARWEGDMFIILLPQIRNPEDPLRISQRVVNQIKQPFSIENHPVQMSVSIGVAVYPQDGSEMSALLQKAEASLNSQKSRLRTNYQAQQPKVVNKSASSLSKAEYLLHQALQKGEFSLYYQPQVNVKTGEVEAMEACLHWHHPKFGLIFPNQFIPLAEKTPLIITLNQWVLLKACQQQLNWRQLGLPPVLVCVSLSSRQLQQPNLIKLLDNVLQKTGLEPHWLELEITEAAIANNIDAARQTLENLRQLGVHLCLRDFGTGNTSLVYLHQIPLHKLKISQSLLRKLKENPQDMAMVAAAIALGRSFNLRVVAEGVETQQQVELLCSLECERMQGSRFSPFLKPEEAARFLSLYRTKAV